HPLPREPATRGVAMTRRLFGAASLAIALLATGVGAATFDVDNTADAVDAAPGDGHCATAATGCTLRAAIQEANAFAGSDVINLPAGVYLLTIAGAAEDLAATG